MHAAYQLLYFAHFGLTGDTLEARVNTIVYVCKCSKCHDYVQIAQQIQGHWTHNEP
jgi:hypothetical protein